VGTSIGMGFWKNLFNGSGTAIATVDSVNGASSQVIGEVANPLAKPGIDSRIFFSKDRNIDLYELEELCDAVGWSRRPIRKVKKAIEHSFVVVTMWERRGNYRRMVGFSRATSDHAFNATIWDVVVHPDFQSRGLGKSLMQNIIRELRREDISNITLFADPQVVKFYQGLGFRSDPEGIKGMFWYPNSRY
jgi:ribosomal protein S18 acetylase RimI-like enzyme